MSIKMRLAGFGLLSLMVALMLGFAALNALQQLEASLQKSVAASDVLRHQMEADMMHDALRGDVLSAMHAAAAKKTEERKELEKELGEHINNFREAIQLGQAGAQSEAVKSAMAEVRPEVDTYLNLSSTILKAAFDKPEESEKIMSFSVRALKPWKRNWQKYPI